MPVLLTLSSGFLFPRSHAPEAVRSSKKFLSGFAHVLGVSLLGAAALRAQTSQPRPAAPTNTAPQQSSVTTFADAIRVLGHERSVAEAYGMLLDTHGKKDMSRYVEGIRLYSEAKADFDGLLEQLKYNLNEIKQASSAGACRSLRPVAWMSTLILMAFLTSPLLAEDMLPGAAAATQYRPAYC